VTEPKKSRVVVADSRGRISLKKFTDHEMHIVDVDSNGVITLIPVLVMPVQLASEIDKFIDNPATGIPAHRPASDNTRMEMEGTDE
jgi:hypothetical protein